MRSSGPWPWAVLREVDHFGIPEYDLASPPQRFWDDEPKSAPNAVEIGVDQNRTEAAVSPANLLATLPEGDNWQAMTRRSLARVSAWFLICEDRQARMRARPVATLAHQASLVRHILEQPNLARVLIADEVGLGKTVEAGLLIRELLQIQPNCRVLYLSPARLVRNVRSEFTRLDLPFRQWVSGGDGDANLRDAWIVASSHRAVHEAHVENVVGTPPWDVLVVDECHHLSDWQAGGGKPVRQYQLVERLIQRMPENARVVLMSGTPHQGHPERFDNLLRLLRRPDEPESALAGRVIYRTKDDVIDWDGNPLFPTRLVNPPTMIDLGPAHREWMEHIYDFFVPGDRATGGQAGRRAAGWRCSMALQWASSSVQAGLGFLVRQAIRAGWTPEQPPLMDALVALRPYRLGSSTEPLDQLFHRLSREVGGQLENDDLDDIEDEEALGTVWRPDQAALAALLREGTELARALGDYKWQRIYDDVLKGAGSEKVVLFAQPIETVTALARFLHSCTGEMPARVIGAQSQIERDREIERFWSPNGPQFLVSSRAGGEGINLQIARRLVHVDVPWNPMELEQRVGRVHRFGSRRRIIVDTVVARRSREVDMYRVAYERLRTVASNLVPEDRFDSLFGRVMSLVPPDELQAIFGGRPEAPLSSEEEGRLRDLVSRGFRDWRQFHERYSGERIRSLDPGSAQWSDLAAFLERHAAGRRAEGYQALRFLWDEGDVIEASSVATVLRLGEEPFAFGDYGGMPVTDEGGQRIRIAGTNVPAIAVALRARGFPEELAGAAHVRWPDDTSLPATVQAKPFVVWGAARRSLRFGEGTPVEVGTSIQVVVLDSEGRDIMLSGDTGATVLRALFAGTVRLRPEATPALIEQLRQREPYWIRSLQQPTEEDRVARVYHAVTPLLAAVVS